jgi:hypothetical protein
MPKRRARALDAAIDPAPDLATDPRARPARRRHASARLAGPPTPVPATDVAPRGPAGSAQLVGPGHPVVPPAREDAETPARPESTSDDDH